jgi:hypothetical protein
MIFRELVTDDYEPLTFRFDGDNRVTCEGGKKK